MWSSLSRADDLVGIVKSMTSVKELKSLQKHLLDEDATSLLRGSTVHRALVEIPKQIHKIVTEDPYKVLSEIADFFL